MFFKIDYTINKSNEETIHISCGTAEVYEDTKEKARTTFSIMYPTYEIQSIEQINEEEDMEPTPILYMLIGIQGSGKTKWITENCYDSQNPYVVSPDKIRAEFGDIDDQSIHVKVFDIAKGRMRGALDCGHNVILDATNVNTRFRKMLLDEFFIKNFRIEAVLFDVEPEVAYERISKALSLEGAERANVPEDVIYRYYGEFLFSKKSIKEEGFDAIHNAEDFKLP